MKEKPRPCIEYIELSVITIIIILINSRTPGAHVCRSHFQIKLQTRCNIRARMFVGVCVCTSYTCQRRNNSILDKTIIIPCETRLRILSLTDPDSQSLITRCFFFFLFVIIIFVIVAVWTEDFGFSNKEEGCSGLILTRTLFDVSIY